MSNKCVIGIDAGGTFTDFMLVDDAGMRSCKVLSTPDNPARAILEGLELLGVAGSDCQIVHGTTVGTNAVLEGKGARVAFITNKGFADLLTIGRQQRESLFELQQPAPQQPVPEELCLEIDARLAADGGVSFTAELENRRAGHWLTTADPERHLLMLATLRTADGRRQARKRDRIGQVWKWAPRAEKVSDNRLPRGSKRRWKRSFSAAASAGAVTLELKIWHVRLSSKNAGYMKKEHVRDDYVPGLTKLVRSLERHYPLATLVYREVVDLASGKRIRSTAAQLIGISAAEQRLPLSARDY